MADTAHDRTEITVASIEAKLAAGSPVEASDVAWLLHALKVATATTTTAGTTAAGTSDPAPDDVTTTPTREQLIAEFKLGPNPSEDMLAYLAGYVVDREADAAAEAADEA